MTTLGEIVRLIYVAAAGLELGFLIMLAYYRYQESKITNDPKAARGMACLAGAFICFLLGSIFGAFKHLDQPLSVPMSMFFIGLIILLVGTYLINTSSLGLRQRLQKRK